MLGETHPNVRKQSGEQYRESLQALSASLGVGQMVEFLDGYRDTAAVLAEVRKADIVLLPYRSRDQVVSGVLVEAIGSGKPVVATAFPHAVELLSGGAGIVVPHEDPAAIAAALRTLLTDPGAAALAAAAARRQAASLTWENVGLSYRQLTREPALRPRGERALTLPAPSFAHLAALSDSVGLFEHARHRTPRPEHGYCTDDVARALAAVVRGAGPRGAAGLARPDLPLLPRAGAAARRPLPQPPLGRSRRPPHRPGRLGRLERPRAPRPRRRRRLRRGRARRAGAPLLRVRRRRLLLALAARERLRRPRRRRRRRRASRATAARRCSCAAPRLASCG